MQYQIGFKSLRVLIAAAVVLTAATPRGRCEEMAFKKPGIDTQSYNLQAGDRLTVKIYPEDEYIKGGEMEVSTEGNVTLPLVGKIPVAGKTVANAQRDIADILSRDYLVDPEVVIEVLQYKQQTFVVLGQVRKPGTYEMPPGLTSITLLQAISIAGGFSDVANTKKIKIMRKSANNTQTVTANAESIMAGKESDVEIEPNDIVHVYESLF